MYSDGCMQTLMRHLEFRMFRVSDFCWMLVQAFVRAEGLCAGTAACSGTSNVAFYCSNFGDSPTRLLPSRVGDFVCDCCDGSDEYATGMCPKNKCRGRDFLC